MNKKLSLVETILKQEVSSLSQYIPLIENFNQGLRERNHARSIYDKIVSHKNLCHLLHKYNL